MDVEVWQLGRRCMRAAAPLVRVKGKFTVKNAVCEILRRQHTAFVTVNLALARTSRAALRWSQNKGKWKLGVDSNQPVARWHSLYFALMWVACKEREGEVDLVDLVN